MNDNESKCINKKAREKKQTKTHKTASETTTAKKTNMQQNQNKSERTSHLGFQAQKTRMDLAIIFPSGMTPLPGLFDRFRSIVGEPVNRASSSLSSAAFRLASKSFICWDFEDPSPRHLRFVSMASARPLVTNKISTSVE